MILYLKLVHYEFTRFRMIYVSLLTVTLLSQFGGLYLYARSTLQIINERMLMESLSEAEYVLKYNTVGFFDFTFNSLWFMAPIAICVTTLLLYVFLIWYRDWLGKNMFIYRLLMLPTSRSNVYLAKLSVILLMVLGLIAFQLLVFPVMSSLYNLLVPSVFRYSVTMFEVISSHPTLSILIPQSIIEFVLYYAVGAMVVVILFTSILMERSYRWKGLIAGIAYAAVASVVFLLPYILSEVWLVYYFYPVEVVLMEAIAGVLVSSVSLWLSFYLLNKKVSV